MIHLNVAFLVICPTIVKILINASPFVVNKCTSNGLFRACNATIIMAAGMHDVHYKHVYSINGCDYTSEFLEFLKVSFVSCLYKFILHVSLAVPDPMHANYSENVCK